MKRITLGLLAFIAIFGVLMMESGKAQAPLNLNWQELGPNNFGNHCRSIAIGNGAIWAGSVGGGLFKSTDQGFSWTKVAGIADNLSVTSIAIDGNNIFVGTGEVAFNYPSTTIFPGWQPLTSIPNTTKGYSGFLTTPGEGVFVSNDGGNTWSHNNATWNAGSVMYSDPFMGIQKVEAVNVGGVTRVYIATLQGLYYSDDNLATVTLVNGPATITGETVFDVETGNGVMWATNKNTLFVSDAAMTTFSAVTNVPNGTTPPGNRLGDTRVEVEVAPTDRNVVYVTGVANGDCSGIRRSTDNGSTWSIITPYESSVFQPFGDKGLYNLALEATASDPLTFYVGGARLYQYSEQDGLIQAASHVFFPGNDEYVPVPIMAIAIDPANNYIYIGGDGEIVRSTDEGETYSFKTKGFNAAHLLDAAASPRYSVFISDKYQGIGYRHNSDPDPFQLQFTKLYDDAFGEIAISYVDFNRLIAQNADGGLVRSFNLGDAFEEFYGLPISPVHPSIYANNSGTLKDTIVDRANETSQGSGLLNNGGLPVTPFVIDEVFQSADLADDSLIAKVPTYVYMASKDYIWVVTSPFGGLDSLPKWNRISPDLTASSEYISAITVSGDNNHVVYVGTTNGNIYRIYNANDPLNMDLAVRFDTIRSGTSIPATANMPSRWITSITFDPADQNNLVVTYGGYDSDSSYVYITNNALDQVNPVAFRSIGETMPPNIPVYSAAIHPDPQFRSIILGTEFGIYSTTDDFTSGGAVNWTEENTGMDRVIVNSVFIRQYQQIFKSSDPDDWKYDVDNTIYAATFGRGLFMSQNTVDRPEFGDVAEPYDITLYPNPSTKLSYLDIEAAHASEVEIGIYNIEGRLVSKIDRRAYPAGKNTITLAVDNLNAGIYFVKAVIHANGGSYSKTFKQIIVR